MTIAADIIKIVTSQEFMAVTLEYGYAIKPSGGKVMFPQPKKMLETRNRYGKVATGHYTYTDKSVIHYNRTRINALWLEKK